MTDTKTDIATLHHDAVAFIRAYKAQDRDAKTQIIERHRSDLYSLIIAVAQLAARVLRTSDLVFTDAREELEDAGQEERTLTEDTTEEVKDAIERLDAIAFIRAAATGDEATMYRIVRDRHNHNGIRFLLSVAGIALRVLAAGHDVVAAALEKAREDLQWELEEPS